MNVFRNMLYMARRFKTATVLNFIGLTVSFAAFYLLMTQVIYNRSYNFSIPDGERVFRLESKMNPDAQWGINCNRPIHALVAKMPQVEAVSELATWGGSWDILVGESTVEQFCMGTNLTPFGAVGARCLDGRLSWDDYGEHSAIIPASLARKVYGRVNVAGEPLYSETDTIIVQGVYEDFPDNCSMKNNLYYATQDNLDNWSEWSSTLYVKLAENVNADTLMKDFPEQMRQLMWRRQWGQAVASGEYDENQEADIKAKFDAHFGFEFRLTPIRDTYFSGVSSDDKGNPAMLFILELASLLIIVIAAINFLNFVLAESPMRIKGINTRRVLGEGLWHLRLGLVGEAVVTSLLACVIAYVLCVAVSRQQTELLLGDLSLSAHPWLAAFTALIAIAAGIAAGTYPAFFATSFQPALALKGSFGLTPKGRQLRTALVCLQIGIALLMVTYIGILLLQSRFIYHSDYGFAKDEVLYAQLSDELMHKKDAIRTELMQIGGIDDVSFSRFVLGSQEGYMGWGRSDDDHKITFTSMPVDYHYLRTMGIKVIEGRDFNEHDGDVYIINEAARRQWPWVEMDKPLLEGDLSVVGVCENVRYASTRQDRTQEPVAFVIFGEKYSGWGDQLGIVNIRVAAGVDKLSVRRQVNQRLTAMGSGEDVEVLFLDEQLENLYQEEFRFIRQVLWFTAVCFVITLIGVFCLTMFETEYRRKEIAIRKVMGSSVGEVLSLFTKRYAIPLILSFVIAAPVGYYISEQWLQNFAEHTPIHWWLFPLAFLIVSIVVLLTVIIQSWRVATMNPVESIKTE
ncbi:MAG: FtsX-like permease family protein [Bacteroidaceae bacterium]|nr:FtsX-like permease family protein [Bacteroidaceae bacterium]